MTPNRRTGKRPIPENLHDLLTPEQATALDELESKGISLFAIRQNLFQDPVVVVKLPAKNRYGVLLNDGMVDYFPEIDLREQPTPELRHFWHSSESEEGS